MFCVSLFSYYATAECETSRPSANALVLIPDALRIDETQPSLGLAMLSRDNSRYFADAYPHAQLEADEFAYSLITPTHDKL